MPDIRREWPDFGEEIIKVNYNQFMQEEHL